MLRNHFSLCFGLFLCLFTLTQTKAQESTLNVMFYNVENLFDIQDDSLTLDNEFLPEGNYHWTYNRMQQKVKNIYKVIVASGEGNLPVIIGLSEIENRYVLNQLVYETPLEKYNYHIVHFESPDLRGIDVAMIYQPARFEVLSKKPIRVTHPEIKNYRTRDILYIKGMADKRDTLHVFVNHWPSRWGGQVASESKRMAASVALRSPVDSILQANLQAKIIITGDFNDNPNDKSLHHLTTGAEHLSIVNLASSVCGRFQTGTLKYQGEWSCFDQFLVSKALLGNTGLSLAPEAFTIFNASFLSSPDTRFSGEKPFRTYSGRSYIGGFSDHYPVLIHLRDNQGPK